MFRLRYFLYFFTVPMVGTSRLKNPTITKFEHDLSYGDQYNIQRNECRPAKSHRISVSLQKRRMISRFHGNATKLTECRDFD